jgi:hypothetical protein
VQFKLQYLLHDNLTSFDDYNILLLILDKSDDNEITVETTSVVRNEPAQDVSGPPKVDSPVEALHEKVKKQIIKEGYGKKPSKLSTCFCKWFIFYYRHTAPIVVTHIFGIKP